VRRATVLAVTMAMVLGLGLTSRGDGDGDGGSAAGGERRTVLVDFEHDEFASAFLQYYPSTLRIRPGDSIEFKQAWTGEPHSVTFGRVVDGFLAQFEEFSEYASVEDALAKGATQERIDDFLEVYERLPTMTDGYEVVPAGAEPCFVEDLAEAPRVRDGETDELLPDAACPEGGREQPAFDGRQAIYNSGFIPYDGPKGNRFEMTIADDAEPGTYQYFCNYHFIFMAGSIQVVEQGADIPSQSEVSRQARREIDLDAREALELMEEAEGLDVGDTVGDEDELTLPLAGRETPDETPLIINEFLPRNLEVKVGQEVTWTFDGFAHTVSFNVPKYFPIFTVAEDGEVAWDPQAYEPVGFDVPRQESFRQEESPPPVDVDGGRWDGRGGFRSSGALNPGDTFSLTFTKAGTYPYACVLHPQMVGTLEVDA
jgi:plastocyanin